MSNLKKFYFIEDFDKDHLKSLDSNINVIYRNYKEKYSMSKILKIKKYCKKIRKNFFLANDINMSIKLGLDGAYIPSFNNNFDHLSYSLKKNFILIGSAHNVYELKTKELQKVQVIFLSSIFKKNKNYLGLYKFNLFSLLTKKKIIALGGISVNNLKKLNLTSCHGFAGISFFE